MKVTHFEEHEDGTATVHLDMELEEQAKLIELGFITALKNYIDSVEESDSD